MSSKELLERMQRLKEEKLRKQQEQVEKAKLAAAQAQATAAASSSSSLPSGPSASASVAHTSTAAEVELKPTFQPDPHLTLRYRDPATDPLAAPFTGKEAAALLGRVAGDLRTGGAGERKRGREAAAEENKAPRQPPHLSDLLSPLITAHIREQHTATRTGPATRDSQEEEKVEERKKRAAAAPLLDDEEYSIRCAEAEVDVYGHERAPCRDVNHFTRDRKIAQGVYGVVFSAFENEEEEEGTKDGTSSSTTTTTTTTTTNNNNSGSTKRRKKYALKHIKKQWLEDSQIGFPPYVLREFDILLRLRHPNLLQAAELVLLDRSKDLAAEVQDRVRVLRAAVREAAPSEGKEGEADKETEKEKEETGKPKEGEEKQSPSPPPSTTLSSKKGESLSIVVGSTKITAPVNTTTTTTTNQPHHHSAETLTPLTSVPTIYALLPEGPPKELKGGLFDAHRMQQEYLRDAGTNRFWTYYTHHDANFLFMKHRLRKRKVTTTDLRHPHGHTSRVYYNENVKDVFLVMDYCSFDLKDYMLCCHPQTRVPLFHISSANTHAEAPVVLLQKIKNIFYQMVQGLFFMHAHRILHRDLKSSNILIDKDGFVKICDFGLARFYKEGASMTPTVVTLMYRAPEIYFQLYDYSHKLDIWSVGCIFAELFLKRPLFKAANEAEHFRVLCDVLGYPTEEQFPGLYQLPEAVRLLRDLPQYRRASRLRSLFFPSPSSSANGGEAKPVGRDAAVMTDSGFDLLSRMLQWNPRDRISAEEILQHPFFSEAPLPCARAELLAPLPSSAAQVGGSSSDATTTTTTTTKLHSTGTSLHAAGVAAHTTTTTTTATSHDSGSAAVINSREMPGYGTPPPPTMMMMTLSGTAASTHKVAPTTTKTTVVGGVGDDEENSSAFHSPSFGGTAATTDAHHHHHNNNNIHHYHNNEEEEEEEVDRLRRAMVSSSSSSDDTSDEDTHNNNNNNNGGQRGEGGGSGKKGHRRHSLKEDNIDSAAEKLKLNANMDTDD